VHFGVDQGAIKNSGEQKEMYVYALRRKSAPIRIASYRDMTSLFHMNLRAA
jgi:hypothetical protein